MKNLVLMLLFLLGATTLIAQGSFNEAIQQGDAAFKRGQFRTAVNKYLAAEAFDPSQRDLVQRKLNAVLSKVEERLKESEKRQKTTATRQEKNPLAYNTPSLPEGMTERGIKTKTPDTLVVFDHSDKSVSIFDRETLQGEIDSLEAEMKSLLAYIRDMEEKQRATETKIQLAQYKPLNFIKVKKEENGVSADYLEDAQGNKYPLAYDIGSLKASTTALDISGGRKSSKNAAGSPNTQPYEQLPVEIFTNPQLKILLASDNKISSLGNSIEKLKNLVVLEINRNELTELSEELSLFSRLITLRARDNKITVVPESIGKLSQLTELDLSFNNLRSLPASIGKLENLVVLNLRDNQLTNIPPSMGNLKHLAELDLSGNELTQLPAEIGNLKNLTRLDLSYNELAALPRQFGEMSALTILDLSFNSLTTLPATTGNLKQLEILDLSDNALTAIPESLLQLPYLGKLDLRNNKLETLPENLDGWARLKEIDLSGNSLSRAEIRRIRLLLPAVKLTL